MRFPQASPPGSCLPDDREYPRSGPRSRNSSWSTLIVLTCYAALALGLTWSWWTPLGKRITTINSADMTLFSWLLNWTPYALSHAQFPLLSDKLNAPAGINLMWNNGMVLPGLLLAPVTWLFGGLATVTVLTTVGLGGSAASGYAGLRAMSVGVVPAALGGALFGFSPAMMAQALGHPDLVFNVLVPVLIILSTRIMINENPSRKGAVLLGVTAGVQLLVGEEVLFDTGVVITVLALILVITYPGLAVRRAGIIASRAVVALGVFGLVAGPPLGYQLFGPLRQHGSPFITSYFATDLTGYVTPTQLQLFAWRSAIERTQRFPGGLEEHTAYLGWPLIALCILVLMLRWPHPKVRTLLLVALVIAVLALGQQLTIAGDQQNLSLPWKLVAGLPGFEHVIPTRFPLFTAGLIGAALAFALDDTSTYPTAVRLAGRGATALALLPLVPAPLPGTNAPPTPKFFTHRAAQDLACPGGSALILPFPWRADSTQVMLWQQAAGMSFAMPGGYFIAPGPDGQAHVGGALSKTGALFHNIMTTGQPHPVTPQMRADFIADLHRWKACTAVLGPTQHSEPLRQQATQLIGAQPTPVDDILLWRDLSHLPTK